MRFSTRVLAKFVAFASVTASLYSQVNSDQLAAHAQAALEAERKNDFGTALHEYEFLARALPQNAEMQSNLGVALYFDHRLTRAVPVLMKAAGLNPKLLAPHLFSGLALYRLSDPDAAVPELETAVQLNASDVIARTWLGYAYVAQSRYEAALREFQAARELSPRDIDVWYALGHSYLEIGKHATLKLLAAAPDGGRAWQLAGEQMQLQGEQEKALRDFQGALERRPDLTELDNLIAGLGGRIPASTNGQRDANRIPEDELYHEAHDAEQKSREAFQRVVEIAPDSYRAHQLMADALTAQQRQSEAIEEFRKALNEKPDLPGIHEAIGRDLVTMGKLDQALQEFQAEIQLQPGSASAHMNAGRVLLMMGNDQDAEKALRRALQLDRPPAETYFYIGKVVLSHRDYRGAIAALKHYVSLAKNDSDAYYLLLHAYRGIGSTQEMNWAYDMYRKTSRDAKARSLAQRELEAFSEKSPDTAQALNGDSTNQSHRRLVTGR